MPHDPECLFCRIVSGEIPSRQVYADAEVIAFEDIHPQAPVHLLIIPKEHIPTVADLATGQALLMGRLVEVVKASDLPVRSLAPVFTVQPPVVVPVEAVPVEEGKEAVAGGSKLLIGGKKLDGPGFFYEPTILLVERDDLEVTRKETFGPGCPIRIVDDEEEAIIKANDTGYGLGATVWTRDQAKALRLARSLEAGNVWINDCGRSLSCGEFFQGWKQSGIPSSQRRIQMFLKKKSVIDHLKCEPRANWFR